MRRGRKVNSVVAAELCGRVCYGAPRFESAARGTICRFGVSDAMSFAYEFTCVGGARLGATESDSRYLMVRRIFRCRLGRLMLTALRGYLWQPPDVNKEVREWV
jgi:hypothetical protein